MRRLLLVLSVVLSLAGCARSEPCAPYTSNGLDALFFNEDGTLTERGWELMNGWPDLDYEIVYTDYGVQFYAANPNIDESEPELVFEIFRNPWGGGPSIAEVGYPDVYYWTPKRINEPDIYTP